MHLVKSPQIHLDKPAALARAAGAACRLCLILLLAGSGCSDGRPQRVPISGVVLIDGKPLKHGVVQFAPVGARPSTGFLNAEGRFSLSSYQPGDGATLGKHKVRVDAAESIGEDTRKWHAPKRYASVNTSGLEVQIDGPRDDVKIELTWDGKAPFVESNL
jgi:hypothetical protein